MVSGYQRQEWKKGDWKERERERAGSLCALDENTKEAKALAEAGSANDPG